MNRRLNKAERAEINRKLHALAAEFVSREKQNLYELFEQNLDLKGDACELIKGRMEGMSLELVLPDVNVQPDKKLPF